MLPPGGSSVELGAFSGWKRIEFYPSFSAFMRLRHHPPDVQQTCAKLIDFVWLCDVGGGKREGGRSGLSLISTVTRHIWRYNFSLTGGKKSSSSYSSPQSSIPRSGSKGIDQNTQLCRANGENKKIHFRCYQKKISLNIFFLRSCC